MSESKRVLLPTQVELLMHSYYSPKSHPEIQEASFMSAAAKLLQLELIRVSHHDGMGQAYAATKRGEAYCEALLRIPLPVAEQIWVVDNR